MASPGPSGAAFEAEEGMFHHSWIPIAIAVAAALLAGIIVAAFKARGPKPDI